MSWDGWAWTVRVLPVGVLRASIAVCIIDLDLVVEETALPGGFFMPAIWVLDESPVTSGIW
jgi:hypothetical protein